MGDNFNLDRFIEPQENDYQLVVVELRAGQKRGHWMWYIFPQIKGLGRSEMSKTFAISSKAEAESYLNHPILGQRLKECTQIVLDVEGRTAEDIFPGIDTLKFRSCMTLFEFSTADSDVFRQALVKYFDGKPDQVTLRILANN